MEEKPKFSLVEIILLMLVVVPIDVLEIITDLISPIPVVGQVVLFAMFFVDLISLFVIQFWLIMKGLRGFWALSANLLEFIPYIDALPLRTIGVITTIVLANRPEAAAAAQVAGAATGKVGK